MDSSLFPHLFIAFVLGPFLFGFGMSFWLVGKGNRLWWILLSCVAWYVFTGLVGLTSSPPMTLYTLSTQWIVAVLMIATAIAFRRFRRARQQATSKNLQDEVPAHLNETGSEKLKDPKS